MIKEKNLDLFFDKNLAHVATKNPDGTLQISPVWIDYDKERELVVFNTARGRKKERNLAIGSPVAISVADSNDMYRYIAVQGEVVEITEEGAREHIDKLAKKYFNREKYDLPEGEIRIKISVKPKFVTQRE